uniref:Mitochondrial import inner membrane translocase subunit TIM14 n=1 Tax=Cacopsylla melanoneura TaxID=428564 RepID=A0A8D8WW99_9HEMI
MASGAILAGLGIAAVGFAGRYLLKAAPAATAAFNEAMKALPKADSLANSRYYKGGFESKMSKREASLILGIGQSSNTKRIKEAHKKIITLNHPDRGGSPYLAAKINQAKDLLENQK